MGLDFAPSHAIAAAAVTLPPTAAEASYSRAGNPDMDDAAAAVTALYNEHALGLIRFAHLLLGSRAGAEDVVHDAFCGLYRRWQHLDDPAKALGYVRSSVLNGCRTVQRRSKLADRLITYQPSAISAEAAALSGEERISQATVRSARRRALLSLEHLLGEPS
jgi:DNA-directed RNA polymerase specialized sigma24 family protein